MKVLAACLIASLLAGSLTGCGDIRPVSSAKSTNLEGAPGTANDAATGGQGNRQGTGNRN